MKTIFKLLVISTQLFMYSAVGAGLSDNKIALANQIRAANSGASANSCNVTQNSRVHPVTTTADQGPGSLREAITLSNTDNGQSRITFNQLGSGTHVINVGATTGMGLPIIVKGVCIDGETALGWAPAMGDSPGTLKVEIHGNFGLIPDNSFAPPGAELNRVHGFVVLGSNTTIKGLAINGFWGNGILVGDENTLNGIGTDHVSILGNYIGTDLTGTIAKTNGLNGVFVKESDYVKVGGLDSMGNRNRDRNVLSGNDYHDLSIVAFEGQGFKSERANYTQILGNYAGLDATGTLPVPNFTDGIQITGNTEPPIGTSKCEFNLIEGNISSAQNFRLISDNNDGIELIFCNKNLIHNNIIGTDVTMTDTTLGNRGVGIFVLTSDDNIFTDNLIANNLDPAMLLIIASKNEIRGNIIINNGFGDTRVKPATGGIYVYNDSNNNIIADNLIGVDKMGQARGNKGFAINLVLSYLDTPTAALPLFATEALPITGATENIITGNVIAHNDGGILIGSDLDNYITSQCPNIFPPFLGGALGPRFLCHAVAVVPPGLTAYFDVPWFINGVYDDHWNGSAMNNLIYGNSIFDNGAANGIDLSDAGEKFSYFKTFLSYVSHKGDGVTPNDPGDGDVGAHGKQNFPLLSAVTQLPDSRIQVTGMLASKPNQEYLIQFYANRHAVTKPSTVVVVDQNNTPVETRNLFSEGEQFLGTAIVNTDNNGNASINVPLKAKNLNGCSIDGGLVSAVTCVTATASEIDATASRSGIAEIATIGKTGDSLFLKNTSEFSPAVTLGF